MLLVLLYYTSRQMKTAVDIGLRVRFHWMILAAGAASVIPMLGSERIGEGMQTFGERLCQMYDGMCIIARYPVFGIGAGNWAYEYPRFQTSQYVTTVVHSSIVQIGVDAGIPAMALAIALFVLGWKNRKADLRFDLAILLVFIHSIFDFSFQFFPLCALSLISFPPNCSAPLRDRLPSSVFLPL